MRAPQRIAVLALSIVARIAPTTGHLLPSGSRTLKRAAFVLGRLLTVFSPSLHQFCLQRWLQFGKVTLKLGHALLLFEHFMVHLVKRVGSLIGFMSEVQICLLG